jgi:hypothetical protein
MDITLWTKAKRNLLTSSSAAKEISIGIDLLRATYFITDSW